MSKLNSRRRRSPRNVSKATIIRNIKLPRAKETLRTIILLIFIIWERLDSRVFSFYLKLSPD